MSIQSKSNDLLDLGSEDTADDINLFATDEDFTDKPNGVDDEEEPFEPSFDDLPMAQAAGGAEADVAAPAAILSEPADNPLITAIDTAETKTAEKAATSLQDKPPVFVFAGISESITDASETFEELRKRKAVDFPELQKDENEVSWTIEYGSIVESVKDAKGTSIAAAKSAIESSKKFLDALKKAKDKNPVCKVKPFVRAQKKGSMPAYKGVFTNLGAANAAGKAISLFPARDGKVYKRTFNNIGTFITPTAGDKSLSEVQAGFIPALPPVPAELLLEVITFFRYLAQQGTGMEVLVNIYWDTLEKLFFVDVPEQMVTKSSVYSFINPAYANERYIHFMDVHSHNSMEACFSATDDKDEKATRVYSVIGRLDKYLPDIKVRISNGGDFLEIDPAQVFEHISKPFSNEWLDNVQVRGLSGDTQVCNKTTFSCGVSCASEDEAV